MMLYIYGCVPFVSVHNLGPIPGNLEDHYGQGRAGPASGWDAYGAAVETRLAEHMPHNFANMPRCGDKPDQQIAGEAGKVWGQARIKSSRAGRRHCEKRR